MTNDDIVRRCVRAGIEAYLEAIKAGVEEESAFLFGKLAFEGLYEFEVHTTKFLLSQGAKQR